MTIDIKSVYVNDKDRNGVLFRGFKKVTLVTQDGRKLYSERLTNPNDPILSLQRNTTADLDIWQDKNGYWNFKLLGHPTDEVGSYMAPQSPEPLKTDSPTLVQAIGELIGALGTTDEKLDKTNELMLKLVEAMERTPLT